MVRLLLSRWFDDDGVDTLEYIALFCTFYTLFYIAIAYIGDHRKPAEIVDFPSKKKVLN